MTEHPYQLRRIELLDFKSVAEGVVDLRPLTIVIGANSSGKSTLLQSILALAQAVRSDIGTPQFPLNGEFVRLGTFGETRNFLAKQPGSPMTVAFDLADTSPRRGRRRSPAERPRPSEPLSFRWRAHLAEDGEHTAGSSGFARLAFVQIEITTIPTDGGEPELRVTCDLDAFGGPVDRRPLFAGAANRGQPVGASGRVVDWTSGESAAVHAVTLSGGLPTDLYRERSTFEILADLWWELAMDVLHDDIIEHRRNRDRAPEEEASRYEAVRVATAQITSLMEAADAPGPSDALPPTSHREHVLRNLLSLEPAVRGRVSNSLAWLESPQFRAKLREELGAAPWMDEVVLVGPPGESAVLLWECGLASRRFFSGSVRYLGPLREAPHVLYDPGPSKLDLGVRGEYAAAVLHAQAATTVLMPTPDGDGEERPLSEALDFWLREFDLVENVRSKDEGRMGIGLSVTPKGVGREVDLTSVGVGVSQVLPVVLLCLLAEPGTLVILEQPELHLHPKLQQNLADFLLACARAGRQLVVETHSEHLVNRLRYQIARDETDDTHELIRLVFAENEDGITSYREPEVNEYGGLGEDWPAGFLDLTAKESQDLVRQSLAKRKRAQAAPSP